MVNPKNSLGIWTRIGLYKKINPITDLKNMPLLIPTTALFWPQPLPLLLLTIPTISRIVLFTAVIPNKKSKKYMLIKDMPENPIENSWLEIKSLTVLCAKIQPRLNSLNMKSNGIKKSPKSDTSLNSILESVTLRIMPNGQDLQTLLKINSMVGIAKLPTISQRG